MAFRWRADDDPLIAVHNWYPLSPYQLKQHKKSCPSWIPSGTNFWIHARLVMEDRV